MRGCRNPLAVARAVDLDGGDARVAADAHGGSGGEEQVGQLGARHRGLAAHRHLVPRQRLDGQRGRVDGGVGGRRQAWAGTMGAAAAAPSPAARALLPGLRVSSPKQASGPLERPAARAPSCEVRLVNCAAAPSRTHPAARRGSRGFGRPARTGPGRGSTGSARTPAGTPRPPPRHRVRER
eukprot:scaffold22825_cov63-Phaeocystis_antarctica.AAC.3